MGPQRKRLLLSKNVLEMKFMRRTKEKTDKELQDEERKAAYAHEITTAMLTHGSKFQVESSYAVCEDLVFGRMSFKGFNPEIEKLMRKAEREKNPLKEDEILQQDKEADVQAAEVVQRYSLTKTINRKFGGHSRGSPRRRGLKRRAED